MAKNFPWFKFSPAEWLTGDIIYEDFAVQGVFINICAVYWQRDGKLTLEDIEKRFKRPDIIEQLLNRFIHPHEGYILITFLDEQLVSTGYISKVNSENGKKGGRPKTAKTLEKKPTVKRTESESKAKKSKEEEDKEEDKETDKKKNIPSESDFLDYCKTLPINYPSLEYSIKAKYQAWIQNNWKDGNNKPIKVWKTKIANTIPFLKPMLNFDAKQDTNPGGVQLGKYNK